MKLIYTGDFERLKDFGFEVGEDYLYEKMHVDSYYNGSKSVVVDENTKEIYIVCYNFSYDESNMPKKVINKTSYVKKYIKDLIQAGLVRNEEEKEIEKIGKIYDGFTDSYYDTCLEKTIKKVDELVDEINKLKKEKK